MADPERGLGTAGTGWTEEQRQNAAVIINVGRQMGLSEQTIAAALATSLMESRLRNLDYGDRDSLGLFQQRPSQGWGTPEQIRDPAYAARKFFEAYSKSTGATVLERIANTQRPAEQYRNDYANFFDDALAIYQEAGGPVSTDRLPKLTGTPTVTASGAPAPAPVAAAGTGGGTVVVTTPASPTELRPDITPDTPPEQVDEYIRTYYPDIAPFLGDPAIKMILYAAAINDWDDRKIEAAILATSYWKTHGPVSRDFDKLLAQDPKGAEQAINRAKGVVGDLFARNGQKVDDRMLGELAKQAIRRGDINVQGFVVNPDGLNGMVAFALNSRGKGAELPAGEAAFNADTLGAIARAYLIPMDRRSLEDWSVKILNGQASEEQFRSYVANLAKGQWRNDPDVVAAMDAGTSPAEFFAPHRNLIAQTLELNPEAIDLTDARYREVTQFHDGKQRRSMTLGEVTEWARSQDAFKNTREYQAKEDGMAVNMLRFMGEVA